GGAGRDGGAFEFAWVATGSYEFGLASGSYGLSDPKGNRGGSSWSRAGTRRRDGAGRRAGRVAGRPGGRRRGRGGAGRLGGAGPRGADRGPARRHPRRRRGRAPHGGGRGVR